MLYRVIVVEEAELDLWDIYNYIASADSVVNAQRVVKGLGEVGHSLAQMPQRGNYPKELIKTGITEYREVHFKPYRVIYRIVEDVVEIHCVVDGRRDMNALLERRLLRRSR